MHNSGWSKIDPYCECYRTKEGTKYCYLRGRTTGGSVGEGRGCDRLFTCDHRLRARWLNERTVPRLLVVTVCLISFIILRMETTLKLQTKTND